MEKVPCTECGALILPATASETGGVCMACKRGIRKNIERSKADYRRRKEYDPFRELWLSLVKRVHETPGGFDSLTEDEKAYFAVAVLDGEVYNGGFDQFFNNSSGEYFEDAQHGLTKLGAETSLRLLQGAAHILFGETVPAKDRAERWAQLQQNPEAADAPELAQLDNEYCSDPDKLSDALNDFAEARGLVTPFRKPDDATDRPRD